MKAEVIRNMPEAEYHADPRASQSRYKAFLETTENKARFALEKVEDDDEKIKAKHLGSCAHAVILEGRQIYVRGIEGDGRTKAVKDARAAQALEHPDKHLLTPKQADDVEGMIDGIGRNKGARMILESATARELSIFTDTEKARIDIMTPMGPWDIKTCAKDVDPYSFAKVIEDWGYHVQAAHYLDMCALAGLPDGDFGIIAVESFAPYDCAIYTISHEALEIGRRKLAELKARYWACIKSGIYRGYSDEPLPIGLTDWTMRKEQKDNE
jgi:exodeoxyribonuclease VIII